ncbi:MAG: DUF1294 domain-containing protein [Ruminococcaceae bacterium]|nr:DUF1294 domain-containing protein [Oscillospiraceae bacterium]
MLTAFIITILSMTFITSIVYSYDFAVAVGQWEKFHRPRLPEYILLTLAALGGGLGAWITMKVQRHKAGNKKKHFRFVIYSSLILNLITFIMLLANELIGG